MKLADWIVQCLQVLTVVGFGPLVTGVIARVEAMVQQRRGPSVWQPYRDILKLLGKETVLPEPAGPLFRAAPYVSFAAYATVPLLIPVLTSYGLPLGYMGDILGGGLILGLGSFVVSLAAIDSGSPYAQLGSSRLRTFGALNEPTVIFVVFTVALTTHTDLPYVMGETLRSSATEVVRPSHLFIVAAFFMLLLNETGRIPVGSHGGTLEFGMIEEARVLEHSGPGLAFLRWGSSVKQLTLLVIFLNILVAPWGLAPDGRIGPVAAAIGLLLAKVAGAAAAIVVIETSFAKLRLYKIPEFTVASFLFAVLAVVMFLFGPNFGDAKLTVFGAFATVTAVAVLLAEYGMLRSQDVWEQLQLYSIGSLIVAALAIATAADGRGNGELYVLGAVTIALKAVLFPLGIRFVMRNLGADPRVPTLMGVPSSILLAIVLSAFAFVALGHVEIGGQPALPLSALPVAVGGVLVALLLMVLRPYAPSQLLGFLILENAVSVGSLVIAPGLPLILALLLLFDVLVGVLVFVVLVQYLAVERTAVRTDVLDRLTG
ncbi:MAG TPA: NADH-quinone oxidoreductase subunit H [Solirubrobacteraceae bacterium]|nr:NADH-quinone oxidoreductase subunit H [Solirubrobacteraceae bacterium]